METEIRARWSSQLTFVLATVGSAVGLGNIWRFPHITGKYGGGAFLLVYILLIATFCMLPILCEMFIGKKMQKGVIDAYASVRKKFKWFGWLVVFSCTVIMGFYFVVCGWILNYILMYISNIEVTNYKEYFNEFVARPYYPIALALGFLIATAVFPLFGVKKGIEKAAKIMMPLLFLMLIGLAIFSVSLPNGTEGLKFLFYPDFSKINGEMLLIALGQALFTLSVGMGVLLTYTSYLRPETNIVKSAYTLITFDTFVAILAGVVIFPAVFSAGLSVDSGPNLVFITLPEVFSRLPFENVVAVVFFVLLFFAAITSAMSAMEVVISAISEHLKISRKKATITTSIAMGILVIPSSLSFGELSDFHILGKNFFDLFDYMTANILMPINALIAIFVVGWFMRPQIGEIFKSPLMAKGFNFCIRYIGPVAFLALIINGL